MLGLSIGDSRMMNERDLGDREVVREASSAISVDPGQTTGVAFKPLDGKIVTRTADFWEFFGLVQDGILAADVFIVEAPYLTNWPEGQPSSPVAYRSGMNHREAKLLVVGLNRLGFSVVEYDPHHSGSSGWDSKSAKKRVVTDNIDWKGPRNQHCIDALHLLLLFGVIG